MSEPRVLTGSDDPLGDARPDARRTKAIAMSCSHGATSALLLPGAKAVTDLTLLDILLARHHRAHDCRCTPNPRLVPGPPARA